MVSRMCIGACWSVSTSHRITSNPTVTAGQCGWHKTKSNVPDIDWKANNGHLLWRIIEEAEKPANFNVLFEKKEKGEVSIFVQFISWVSHLMKE